MTAVAIACAALIDRALGEPPEAAHPVAVFGVAMTSVEQRIHRSSVAVGAGYTIIGVGLASVGAGAVRRAVGATGACIVVGAVAMAGTMLDDEVRSVRFALHQRDVGASRTRIARLVGRSTAAMDAPAVARAAIETLAENTVDAVTATMFWGTCAGAPGVAIHRAANTMDAMVGHRTERHAAFGRVSARLDDALNWLPARLTVLAVVISMPMRAGEIVRTVRRDARRHPSPNGGVVEAAFAAALGLRLGGVNHYGSVVEDRGLLGDGRDPTAADIDRAIALARRVQAVFALVCVMVDLAVRCRRKSGRSRRCGR